jgi:hypothetical protein
MRTLPSTTRRHVMPVRQERTGTVGWTSRGTVTRPVDTNSATADDGVAGGHVPALTCEDSHATASSAGASEAVDSRSATVPTTRRIGPRRTQRASC